MDYSLSPWSRTPQRSVSRVPFHDLPSPKGPTQTFRAVEGRGPALRRLLSCAVLFDRPRSPRYLEPVYLSWDTKTCTLDGVAGRGWRTVPLPPET